MTATLLVGRVREALGVELRLPAVFESQTVAQLANRIDELAARADGDGGTPLANVAGPGAAKLQALLPVRRYGRAACSVDPDESR
jgi:hypothetical protein